MPDPQNPTDASPRELASTEIGERVSEQVGTVIGPYELLEQIGEGGFRLVFVAEQERPVSVGAANTCSGWLGPNFDRKGVMSKTHS